ncbi:Retrovirus-related Pol polyprotein from transposon TNT 1-94 [Gossypium australe]|uniref:Retrovirus-related Pol polyprotein from transposon TNT 1-94 n=1 Tax=Gossypium australe TaxID=47621 RepID=A0A5B6UZX0_9ROSI|nr:Retrovirus-related Pol polyprotein from transposon TNT 1-94 [Gossypium australe]
MFCIKKQSRLIDSGYTNHMTSDESIFRKIDGSCISKVRIGNGELIQARGKGDVLINTPSDSDCTIFDSLRQEIVTVSILDKSFVLDWNLATLNLMKQIFGIQDWDIPLIKCANQIYKGHAPIAEIYQRANVAVLEPSSFKEVEAIEG